MKRSGTGRPRTHPWAQRAPQTLRESEGQPDIWTQTDKSQIQACTGPNQTLKQSQHRPHTQRLRHPTRQSENHKPQPGTQDPNPSPPSTRNSAYDDEAYGQSAQTTRTRAGARTLTNQMTRTRRRSVPETSRRTPRTQAKGSAAGGPDCGNERGRQGDIPMAAALPYCNTSCGAQWT